MALENYTGKIADMVVTNPTPTDPKSQGDDHLRGIKFTLQQSFPNFDGPLNAARVPFTPAGIIAANNVQAAIQELDTEKLSLSGGTMTGQVNGITPTAAANLTRKDYVDGANYKGQIGYQKLPSGIIIQWGKAQTEANGKFTGSLAIPFPNASWIITGSVVANRATTSIYGAMCDFTEQNELTHYDILVWEWANGTMVFSANQHVDWIAIGH